MGEYRVHYLRSGNNRETGSVLPGKLCLPIRFRDVWARAINGHNQCGLF